MQVLRLFLGSLLLSSLTSACAISLKWLSRGWEIIPTRREERSPKEKRMKCVRLLLSASIVSVALLLIVSTVWAQYVPKSNEELYGTWTNDKTINAFHVQKRVHTADGRVKEYDDLSGSTLLAEGPSRIDRKWTDSDGNVWYEVYERLTAGVYAGYDFQRLFKLSKSATVLEYVQNHGYVGPNNYPAKIDPSGGAYKIFYRAAQ